MTLAIYRCELLSFFSIFGIQNNQTWQQPNNAVVVNCFHFSVSLGYKTTWSSSNSTNFLLWIAFIFQYLWDTKQRFEVCNCFDGCCELLSFFSIFGIQNNSKSERLSSYRVVNCFHFSVSLGYKTTISGIARHNEALWIAFIFQYLWDTKQRSLYTPKFLRCCELLSFFSIFGIHNNRFYRSTFLCIVVNCFHFSVSLGYKTTDYVF